MALSLRELLRCTRYRAPLLSCVFDGCRVDPRPRPRVLVVPVVDDERSDSGGVGGVVRGPGVRLTTLAFASIIRDVTASGRRNDVLREDVKSAVRRRSPAPWEKSGKNPTQSARDPAACSKYSGLSNAFGWIRMFRTILYCEGSWIGSCPMLISVARLSVSGCVVGF